MATDFTTILAKLKAILEELEGVGKPLKEVYAWANPSPKQWPSAFVTVNGGSEEARLDSASNFLDMQFLIRIMLREKNTAATEALRVSILDQVLTKLREYPDTLDDTVQKFDIESITPVNYSNTESPLIGFDIIVTAGIVKAI